MTSKPLPAAGWSSSSRLKPLRLLASLSSNKSPAVEYTDRALTREFLSLRKDELGARLLADACCGRFMVNAAEGRIAWWLGLLTIGLGLAIRGLALEGLANRDSLPYAETYGLGSVDSMWNVFRGTLRYQGFSRVLDVFREIGLLSTSPKDAVILNSTHGGWQSLVASSLARKLGDIRTSGDTPRLCMVPSSFAGDLPPLPSANSPVAPLDLLTTLLAHKLRYKPDERDMVILSHEIISVPKSSNTARAVDPLTIQGGKKHTSTLVTYGIPSILGASAMARTVGLPLAIAALKVLDGKVASRGVKGPCDCGRPLWGGVLEGLEERGIAMKESSRPLSTRGDLMKFLDEGLLGRTDLPFMQEAGRLPFGRTDQGWRSDPSFK
ncbi:hypothetical protein M407DRAFT_215717 [Tulasnella calospora MUT 4182]|uniref:Saccharopine dehydrogenase-like C-terminal domain-containing protein n=1 Tax=Tulasnella calospora MUT 4182 TaxID=1051891 RepID=A0A0C3KNK6_9AGAM|nr:hypothetical protein M407DRAFT_215717 [Tulasnella calospora MUT 4182]